jgi:hypothetical protein
MFKFVRTASLLAMIAYLVGCAQSSTQTKSAGALSAQDWERVAYPGIPSPWPGNCDLTVDLSHDSSSGLRLDLFMGAPLKAAKTQLPLPADLPVFFHVPGGSVLKADVIFDTPSPVYSIWDVQWDYAYALPFSEHQLAAAWIEIRLPSNTYWLEVPYGLSSPRASNTGELPAAEPNTAAATSKPAGDKSQILHWRSVQYQFALHDKSYAEIDICNGDYPSVQIHLSKYDRDNNWMTHPSTLVSYQPSHGQAMDGVCAKIERSYSQRIDTFNFNNLERDESSHRAWGILSVVIDDQTFQLSAPSSLFWFGETLEPKEDSSIKSAMRE